MVSEELWAAMAYNGDAAIAITENPDLAFFIPEEGADIYLDVFAMPRDAKNKSAAATFMNFILDPENQTEANEWAGYASPNKAAPPGE